MVSDFSAKVGIDSAGKGEAAAAVETGDAAALGEAAVAAGELLAAAVADGVATTGTGGGKCVAV
jgi:hypothetical protein